MKTITEPTADEQLQEVYRSKLREADELSLETGKRYALCLLKLADAVTPDDYAALAAAINDVDGVQQIRLVVDHVTRASVPAGKELAARIEANVVLRDSE